MSVIVPCTSCSARLMLGEQLLGKKVKCPKCGGIIQVADNADEADPEARISERPLKPRPAPVKDVKVLPPPLPSNLKESDEERDDDLDEDLDRPRKKKKKKKKKRQGAAAWSFFQNESWPWWVFGVSGVVVVEFVLLFMTIFLPPGHVAKPFTGYLFVMCPISTLVFFAAMYLSSIWFGALEVGELHVAFVKAYILVAIVNVVSLIPCGFLFTLLIWFGGILSLFRLDAWEARILIFMNWMLNTAVRILIIMLLASMMPRGGFDLEIRPGQGNIVNIDDDD